MTEIGMALSNPLEGKRMEGCVGSPLPGVQARIVRLSFPFHESLEEYYKWNPHTERKVLSLSFSGGTTKAIQPFLQKETRTRYSF